MKNKILIVTDKNEPQKLYETLSQLIRNIAADVETVTLKELQNQDPKDYKAAIFPFSVFTRSIAPLIEAKTIEELAGNPKAHLLAVQSNSIPNNILPIADREAYQDRGIANPLLIVQMKDDYKLHLNNEENYKTSKVLKTIITQDKNNDYLASDVSAAINRSNNNTGRNAVLAASAIGACLTLYLGAPHVTTAILFCGTTAYFLSACCQKATNTGIER